MTVNVPSPTIVEYLAAAGVSAVCIVIIGDIAGFRVATDLRRLNNVGLIVSAHWLPDRSLATKVARSATSIAGAQPTQDRAFTALYAAAKIHGARLVSNETVIERSTHAAMRLDHNLRAAAATGGLSVFHKEYRRRRAAALVAGKPFMSFSSAAKRFRRAVVGSLISGAPTSTLFAEVFDD